jgi:2-oxoglutarate ferredoxin oxidoreductase subunit beta
MATGTENMEKRDRKHYLSDISPKWCPGCGDHAVFSALTSVFAELDMPREKLTVISGIGCSSRFPYYLSSYGFHTIHGRAPAVALGAKLANPDLNVWVITGDGDALSIGGNHFMHLMRRNANIKVILFNNEIYGLTKGQASPTSKTGLPTKTTPLGSIDRPIRPLSVALAAGATFAARVVDNNPTLMKEVLTAAAKHEGVAVVEVLVNCIIFNNNAHEKYQDRKQRDNNTIVLKDGAPLIFGENKDRGIVLDGLTPKAVTIGQDGITEEKILTHRLNVEDTTLAHMLSEADAMNLPLPIGILYQTHKPTYEERLKGEREAAIQRSGEGDLDKLLNQGDTWRVD